MIKILILILFTFQQNPGNENDKYIVKELSNLNELIIHGKFEMGCIIVKGDTIKTQILRFAKRKNRDSYLFCVIKNDADSFKVYTAKQIEGYIIGNELFKTHVSKGDTFFIRMEKKGRAILYERIGLPSDDRFLYYIQLPDYNIYFVICPNEQSVTLAPIIGHTTSTTTSNFDSYYTDNTNQKFKIFVNKFLGDCLSLTNLVQTEFFTIVDLPGVIETYNKCFE
jgi:hypothetical protein